VILAELDSVAIRWVRQEALLGATLKKRSHYFHSNLIRTQLQKKNAACFSVVRVTAQKATDILHRHHSENIKFKLFVYWFI
jgi:hypothetical protein